MIFKKVSWLIKRHPFLYLTRFKLLSKNSNLEGIKGIAYNQINLSKDIPNNFKEINEEIFKDGKPSDDFAMAKAICLWLQDNVKGGPGLSEPSDRALQIMLEGKGGVCSDLSQVFNNFCVINGIKVREWGTTRAPFNREYGGHSFNEIYSKTLKKWVLLDVSSSLLFYHKGDEPLSVVELYQLIRANEDVSFETFNKNKPLIKNSVKRNYLDPGTIPFLICNYSNKTYDSVLRYTRPLVPVFVSHFFIFAIGKSYYYSFPLDDYKKIVS